MLQTNPVLRTRLYATRVQNQNYLINTNSKCIFKIVEHCNVLQSSTYFIVDHIKLPWQFQSALRGKLRAPLPYL